MPARRMLMTRSRALSLLRTGTKGRLIGCLCECRVVASASVFLEAAESARYQTKNWCCVFFLGSKKGRDYDLAVLENKYDEVEVYSWWERNVEIGIVIWMSGGRRAPNFGLEQESLNEKKKKKKEKAQ